MGFFSKIANKMIEGLLKSAVKSSSVESLNPYIGMLLKAEEDDLIADEMFRLSQVLKEGTYGVVKDERRAKELCLKAAEKGHEVAQSLYAMWLMRKPDDASIDVLYWLQKAAEQGERQSLYNLGVSIHRGDISVKNPIEDSLPLFRKSAELGFAPAYSRMAWIYHAGEGVEANDTIAKYWAWLDYANTFHVARERSIFYILANPSDLTPESIINHKKIIQEAAEAGEADALNNWGTELYSSDPEEGMALQKRAIDLGHQIAACNMGKHLWTEEVKDYSAALPLFQSSAEWGCAEAQYSLAVMYGEGLGVKKNIPLAWEWLEKSINKGCNDARRYFAHLIMTNQLLEILPDKVMRGPSYLELSQI